MEHCQRWPSVRPCPLRGLGEASGEHIATAGACVALSGGGPPIQVAALLADRAPLLATLLHRASFPYGALIGRAVRGPPAPKDGWSEASTRRADDDDERDDEQ